MLATFHLPRCSGARFIEEEWLKWRKGAIVSNRGGGMLNKVAANLSHSRCRPSYNVIISPRRNDNNGVRVPK